MNTQFRSYITNQKFINQFDVPPKIIKRITHNTFEYVDIDGLTKVRLYETDILIYKDKSIILKTGGFYSNLTKDRLNSLIIGRIYQKKGVWSYTIGSHDIRFFDGIEINNETGEVINQDAAPAYVKIDEKNKQINKLITAYCKKVDGEDLPDSSDGDCWDCTMFQSVSNLDHLLNHLKEKYIMKTLIFQALSDSGYNNPSFIYQTYKTDKKKSAITRALRNYFKQHLIKKV